MKLVKIYQSNTIYLEHTFVPTIKIHNMYPKIRLSRLELIENSNRVMNECPIFVLMFLANSLAIKYNPWKNSIDDLIYTIQKVSESQPYLEENDLTGIAGFINPHCEWDKESLILAFKDAYNFTPQIPILPQRKFNKKTPDEPLTIDEFMMFQICIRYRIPVNRNTSFEDCSKSISEWSARISPLRQSIFQRLCQFSRQQLVSIKGALSSGFGSSDSLDLNNHNILDKIAKHYRIDASDSDNPEEELARLERSENDFLPVSLSWRNKYLINSSYYHLDSRYIPKYDEFYSEKTKAHLLYLSGASENENGSSLVIGIDPYIDTSRHLYSNIMKISIPSCPTCLECPICTICQTEKLRHFISSSKYVYHETGEPLIFTREELIDHFNFRGNFTIPTNMASEFAEADLLMISRNSVGHELVNVINNLKKSRETLIADSISCLNLLKSIDVPVRLLKGLENIGFVMRGWETAFTEIKDLPVKSSSYGTEFQDQVEDKTIEKILDLMKDHRINVILNRMPLLKIRYRSNERVVVTYGKDVSVKDRLMDIITNPNKEATCIRDNSNMILTTSHFFMTETGLSSPMFSLDDLNHIQ